MAHDELPLFVLVSDSEKFLLELEWGFELCVVRMTLTESLRERFDRSEVVLIDIDTPRGHEIAHQVSLRSPFCNLATVSTDRRPEDRIMNIRKPLDWTDLQLLLIRAGMFD